ncbi:Transposase IS116/IS110/IS902 family [Citrobacter freundii]|nr:Transposase IS116/IS110/IS902 family [Citrobacter freundii]
MATALATQIKVVSEIIKIYDERIETLFDTLPDAGLFKSLPGMGPCMGPRMLAAPGDNRDRFNSAEEIQYYAGIAPVTERSGQKSWVHWSEVVDKIWPRHESISRTTERPLLARSGLYLHR